MMKHRNRAVAAISGGKKYPDLRGTVTFNGMEEGVFGNRSGYRLPVQNECCGCGGYVYHIQSGGSCTGPEANEFADADKI